jgi:hypothetical protein
MMTVSKFDVENNFEENMSFLLLIDKLITHYNSELQKLEISLLKYLPQETRKLSEHLTYLNDCFKDDLSEVLNKFYFTIGTMKNVITKYNNECDAFKVLSNNLFDKFYPLP